MGVVDSFKDSGVLAKAGFVTLLVTAVFAWIAYTCTGWGGYDREPEPHERSGTHFGLWRKCSDSKYSASCDPLDGWALEWFGAFQAFVTLGFFGINVALFLLVLYMFVPSCQRNGEVGKAAGIICCITAFLYLVGVVVFAIKYKTDYIDKDLGEEFKFGYCFALSVVAIVLEGVSGVFVFLEAKLNGTSSPSLEHLNI